MTDYTTLEAVKAYLRITSDADDALLAQFITRASRVIEDHCGRRFDTWQETRRYGPQNAHFTGHMLLLDADLLSLTAITNGDGVALQPADVMLAPEGWPPYFGIYLPQSSGKDWVVEDDPAGAIEVSATWGFSESVPEPIAHAAVRLTAWLYRQRDTGAEGSLLPRDVRDLLAPYIRLRMKALGWPGAGPGAESGGRG